MEKLNSAIKRISPSLTISLTAKAREMGARGIKTINFAAGEPDFDTPDNIKEAAIKAIRNGFTKYTPAGGTDEIRKAVTKKEKKVNDLEYKIDNVCISVGAKHALFNICAIMLNEGDEVIIPAPYWVTYEAIVQFAGAKPIIVNTGEENGFVPNIDSLEKIVSDKTKLIIVNNPSNPTGATYTVEDLENIATLAKEHDFWIVSDEIYEDIVFDEYKPISIATLSDDAKARTLIVNGVSKSYSMTGWRIGYTCGDKDIISSMIKLQSQSTTNPTTIAQAAAIEALTGNQDSVKMMRSKFKERRDYIVEALNNIDGITCFNPKGAFYAFPNVSKLFGKSYKGKKMENSMDFSMELLNAENVVTVPGVAFGNDKFIRISFATDMEAIKDGVKAIGKFVKNLQ